MTHKIIVIDDDLSILRMCKKLLSARLFEVDTAAEIEEAKELIAKNAYLVSVVDLGLSHPDYTGGLDLVTYIKNRHPKTMILVYTANENPQVKALALESGASLFLVKPVPLDSLCNCIMGLCSSIPGKDVE